MSIYVEDSDAIGIENFLIPEHYKESINCVIISHGLILDRIEKVASDILQVHGDHTVYFLCILKGATRFCHDLWKAYEKIFSYSNRGQHVPVIVEFIRIHSYENTGSTGNIVISNDLDFSQFDSKHVVVVEDLVDSGATLYKLKDLISERAQVASLSFAVLCEKRVVANQGEDSTAIAMVPAFNADFVGFSIPNKFIVGYGMDYNQVFRDLSHICAINQVGIQKYKV